MTVLYNYYLPYGGLYYRPYHPLHPYHLYHPYAHWYGPVYRPYPPLYRKLMLMDYGPEPFTIDIEDATEDNTNYRTALWTGNNLQVTLMSIAPGDDIGLEVHTHGDQFIRIEDGRGLVEMGPSQDNLKYSARVESDDAIMIPAGTWHNVTNVSNKPLKLYAIYAPPEHPRGTIHVTKSEAMDDEYHEY